MERQGVERREGASYCYRRDDVSLLSRRAICLFDDEEVEVACSQRSVVVVDLWEEAVVRMMMKGDSYAA
jgi:hypothetical protein